MSKYDKIQQNTAKIGFSRYIPDLADKFGIFSDLADKLGNIRLYAVPRGTASKHTWGAPPPQDPFKILVRM